MKTKQPTAAEIAAFREREAANAGRNDGGRDSQIVSIGRAKMDNEPEFVKVGPLSLLVHALTPKRSAQLQSVIERHYPVVLIYAAMASDEPFIDYEATAAMWSAVQRHQYEAMVTEWKKSAESGEDLPEPIAPMPVSVDAIADEIKLLRRRMTIEVEGVSAEEDAPRVVDAIAQAAWFVADETPGLTPELLAAQIEEHLTIPRMADLLRVIWLAVGGFPGCMADRFA